jgi:hypothetical protein
VLYEASETVKRVLEDIAANIKATIAVVAVLDSKEWPIAVYACFVNGQSVKKA